MAKKNRIIETYFGSTKLEEMADESGNGKKYIISGPFTMADRPNLNNRIYPKDVMNEAISKFRDKVQKRQIKMAMDHPGMFDGGTLSKTCAILLDVTDIQEDGYAYYKAQIIDTTYGKDLKAILDAGAMVGVSTRGYGPQVCDQEYPGVDGKHDVIQKGYVLENIDFVDTPAVSETENGMTLESKRSEESMPKSLDELKSEFPSIFDELEASFTAKLNESNVVVESFKQKAEAISANFDKLVESIKAVKPEMFVTIPESEVISAKDGEIQKLTDELNVAKKALESANEQLTAIEAEKVKISKDKEIETIKANDPEFAKFDSLMAKFEACINAEEVRKVYDANKTFLDEFKKVTDEAAAKPKTENEAQVVTDSKLLADLKLMNDQRKSAGLAVLSVEDYKKIL